jgi:hypothetical protein
MSKYPMDVFITQEEDRFVNAAMEFCRQDRIIRELKRALRRCEYGKNGLPSTSTAPCEFEDDSERCEPCQERYAQRPAYKAALGARSRAKARMVRWAAKIKEPHSDPQ